MVNNFSPFIADIVSIFNELDNKFDCYDCNQIQTIDTHLDFLRDFDNVILSGRQKNSVIINKINSSIVKACLILDKPLLGICYGGQILALTLGCTLKKIQKVKNTIQIDLIEPTPILEGYTSVRMYESHNFCISALSSDFKLLGTSESCTNELFCFRNKPLFGTQFHPEKSGRHGKDMLRNFLKLK
ncbi:glutamine amidotransferase-related protein [Candidatus Nitrosocosmicus franklandus]|uniref:glutamine amidotransferase-related protein n=1 Tax=Candidatus Nitrosocosmicus franklandianus TaxID=1798806 RepID=UPI001559C5FE|nr:gamma-glutamyl-gamma-aminobutyrate hydrolase family protein [Candidatus Nitrosocosmicus franklandus]